MGNGLYLMRHAESWANRDGVIVSHIWDAHDVRWGLTPKGIHQVFDSVAAIPEAELPDGDCVFAHGPFVRHIQTAYIASGAIKMRNAALGKECHVRLVERDEAAERFFGKRNGGPTSAYQDVWKLDAADPSHTTDGVESVLTVRDRMAKLALDLRNEHDGANVIIVSSGDPLQLLEIALRGLPPSAHRTLKAYEKAEIRLLRP